MFAALNNNFNYSVSNVAGVRPATNFGTSLTPAQNSYPAYTQLISGASVAYDCHLLRLNVNSIFTSTQARDAIMKIGIDLAGGTSYTDFIADLLVSCANTYLDGGAIFYEFPVMIPAGASVAAAVSVNNATVGNARVVAQLYGQPSRPELVRSGCYVRSYGTTPASSSGTAVTPGTTSDGSWTQIGAIADGDTIFDWEFGYGVNNTVMSAQGNHVDIAVGDATNKEIVIEDALVVTGSTEYIMKSRPRTVRNVIGVAGQNIYARIQSSGSALSGTSIAVYGTGG